MPEIRTDDRSLLARLARLAEGHFIFAQVLIAVIALSLSAHIYNSNMREAVAEAERDLAAVHEMKFHLLDNWLDERFYDIGRLTADLPLRKAVESVRPVESLSEEIGPLLDAVTAHSDYSGVYLVNDKGGILLSRGGSAALALAGKCPARIFSTGEPCVSEITAEKGVPHIFFYAPLSGGGKKAKAAIVMEANPANHIFPLLQDWPMSSSTAETLLAKELDGQAVFINKLRHSDAEPLSLRLPLPDPDLPIAYALRGDSRIFRGTDYRGKEVFSFTGKEERTGWGMVTKIDAAEVVAAARAAAAPGIAMTILGAVLASLLLRGLMRIVGRRYHRELELMRGYYDNFIRDAQECFFIIGPDGAILEANATAGRLYGIPQERLRTMRFGDLAAGTDTELNARINRDILELNSGTYECLHSRAGAAPFHAEIRARKIQAEGRTYIHAIVQDISVRKRLEIMEREEKSKLEALVRLTRIARGNEPELLDAALAEALKLTASDIGYIYTYSEESKLFTLNSWSAKVMDACRVTEKQTVYELEKTGIWGEVVRQRKGLIVNDYKVPDRLKKGLPEGHCALERWMSVPVFSGDSIVAVLGLANSPEPYGEEALTRMSSFMDGVWRLVEVGRSALKIREAETRFEATVRNLTGAVYRCLEDSDWTMEYLSPGIGALTGYRPEDFTSGKVSYASLVHEDDREELRGIISAALNRGEPFNHTYRLRRADGREIWVWEQGRLAAASGAVRKIDGYIADTTEARAAAMERERLNTELRRKNKELEDFLYITTHDLRSPLVNIQGFSQNLEEYFAVVRREAAARTGEGGGCAEASRILEGKIPEALRFITTSAAKMDGLINSLLRLSRLGRAPLSKEAVNMDEMAAQVASYFSFRAGELGGEVRVSGKLPPCLADRESVNQMLSNFVENALKYRHPERPPVVEISGESRDGRSVYAVRDNGLGIPDSLKEKVWQIFYRGDPANSESGEGIGLSVVTTLAEKNQGRSYMESRPGEGTIFYLELPAPPQGKATA